MDMDRVVYSSRAERGTEGEEKRGFQWMDGCTHAFSLTSSLG